MKQFKDKVFPKHLIDGPCSLLQNPSWGWLTKRYLWNLSRAVSNWLKKNNAIEKLLEKFAPVFQPMESRTNHTLYTLFFPRFERELWLAHRAVCSCCDWLSNYFGFGFSTVIWKTFLKKQITKLLSLQSKQSQKSQHPDVTKRAWNTNVLWNSRVSSLLLYSNINAVDNQICGQSCWNQFRHFAPCKAYQILKSITL